MKLTLKKWIGPLIVGLTLVVVVIIGLASGEMASAVRILRTTNPLCIAACILCYLGYLLFEGLSIHAALASQGLRISLYAACRTALIGQFYSNLTPAATGGQPMQLFYLKKFNISPDVGSFALIGHFIAFQIMLTILTAVFAAFHWQFLTKTVDANFPIFAIGYIYNLFVTVLVITLCITRRPVRWMIRIAVRIVNRFHLSKNPQALGNRLTGLADNFHDCMISMVKSPRIILPQLFLCGVQLMLMMSILMFVYLGLGFRGARYDQLVTMGLAQYISAAYAPLPGASGAQESVFSLYFASLLPGSGCYAGMLLWRFMTYYLGLLFGAVVLVFHRHQKTESQYADEQREMADFVEKYREAEAGYHSSEPPVLQNEHKE